MLPRIVLASVVAVLAVGCGGSPSSVISSYPNAALATKDDVSKFVTTSAAEIFGEDLIIAQLGANDAGCPAITDDGTTQTVTGNGCTDKDGATWSGSARYVRADGGLYSGSYQYSGLGYTGGHFTCADGGSGTGGLAIDGTVTMNLSPNSTGTNTFTTDLKVSRTGYDSTICASRDNVIGLSYSGTAVQVNNSTGTGTVTTWNGSGKYGSKVDGQISMVTKDEVIDGTVCNSEAASGTTTITSGGNTAIITYDGASKCDPDSTVKVSLNGADQGELSGVSCATAPGLWWTAGLALIVLALRRRLA